MQPAPCRQATSGRHSKDAPKRSASPCPKRSGTEAEAGRTETSTHRHVLLGHVLPELIGLFVVLVVGAGGVLRSLPSLLCERRLRRSALILLRLRQPYARLQRQVFSQEAEKDMHYTVVLCFGRSPASSASVAFAAACPLSSSVCVSPVRRRQMLSVSRGAQCSAGAEQPANIATGCDWCAGCR